MSEVIIKRATPDDALKLSELSKSTFYDTYAAYNTEENMQLHMSSFDPVQLTEEIGERGIVFFIAWLNGQMVGYTKLSEHVTLDELKDQNPIEIERIYVRPDLKGNKIGSKLVQYCVAYAKEIGKNVIWLGVWEHNPKAIAFYEALGFVKFGKHDFVLGSDVQNDWLMKLQL